MAIKENRNCMTLESFLESASKQKVKILPEEGKATSLDELYSDLIQHMLPKENTVIKWNNLLMEYVKRDDAIFFIRRYASASNKQWDLIRRGFLTEYSSGLKYVFCDNYFAHYFYLMALKDFVPTINEFHKLIQNRRFPYGYMKTRSEEPYQAYPKGKYVNINKSGWKLAHLYSLNQKDYNFNYKQQSKYLFPRGNQSDWKIQSGNSYPSRFIEDEHSENLRKVCIAHFLRLAHPLNYFLVPKTKLSNIDIGEKRYLISFMREKMLTKFGNLILEYEEAIMAQQTETKDKPEFKFNLKYGLSYKKDNVVNSNPKILKQPRNFKKTRTTDLNFSNIELSIIKAYLVDKKSYRTIEKEIMKIPSADRGGGFLAKEILNSYGIEGKHKGTVTLKNIQTLIYNKIDIPQTTLLKLQEYIKNH